MNLIFRCKHVQFEQGLTTKEAIIPVILSGPTGEKFPTTAILDSGSDFTLLPIEVAKVLKLDYHEEEKTDATGYAGNLFTTTKSKVQIKIQKGHETVECECLCMINLDEKKQHDHVILGSTFFERFRITFDYPNNRFLIKGS